MVKGSEASKTWKSVFRIVLIVSLVFVGCGRCEQSETSDETKYSQMVSPFPSINPERRILNNKRTERKRARKKLRRQKRRNGEYPLATLRLRQDQSPSPFGVDDVDADGFIIINPVPPLFSQILPEDGMTFRNSTIDFRVRVQDERGPRKTWIELYREDSFMGFYRARRPSEDIFRLRKSNMVDGAYKWRITTRVGRGNGVEKAELQSEFMSFNVRGKCARTEGEIPLHFPATSCHTFRADALLTILSYPSIH